jgi:hypothetical protein
MLGRVAESVVLLFLTACNGEIVDPPVPPPVPPLCNPVCPDGARCTEGGTCGPLSICNLEQAEFFRPEQPAGVCVRIACGSSEECDPGRYCSLRGVCDRLVCETHRDCRATELCVAGSCTSDTGTRCSLETQHATIRAGDRLQIYLRLSTQTGETYTDQFGDRIEWMTDNPDVVHQEGASLVGGELNGQATLRARFRDHECDGMLIVQSVGTTTGARVLLTNGAGALSPVSAVSVFGFETAVETASSATGVVEVSRRPGALKWLTTRVGSKFISFGSPLPSDIRIVVEQTRSSSLSGGFLGAVVWPPRAQSGVGGYGAALNGRFGDLDPLDTSRPPLFGNGILERYVRTDGTQRTLAVPGGLLFPLDYEDFMNWPERATRRCGTRRGLVGADLGCFILHSEEDTTGIWTRTRTVQLSDLEFLHSSIERTPQDEPFPWGAGLARLLQGGGWATDILLTAEGMVDSSPRLPDGGDDIERFAWTALRPQRSGQRYIRASVPRVGLESTGASVGQIWLGALASVGAGRWYPLGVNVGSDGTAGGIPDGLVDGTRGFQSLTSSPEEGEIDIEVDKRIARAFPHDVVLAAIKGQFESSRPLEFTLLLERASADEIAFETEFYNIPEAILDLGAGTLSLNGLDTRVKIIRIQIDAPEFSWIVFALAAPVIDLAQFREPFARLSTLRGVKASVATIASNIGWEQLASGEDIWLQALLRHSRGITSSECVADGGKCRLIAP